MKYNDESRNFTLTATGDIFITRSLRPYTEPAYLDMWKIVQDADIRFTNFEMLVHNFEGYPVAQSGGTYTQVDETIMLDMDYAGFNLFSLANNHSLDYSATGMRRTIEIFDDYGFTHAGTGENLSDARSPRFLDLDNGRVALIAAASSFAAHGAAGEQRNDSKGRPGLNPVHYNTYYEVDKAHFEYVKKLNENTGSKKQKDVFVKAGWRAAEPDGVCSIGATKFVQGDNPGIHTTISKADREGNLKWISDAARQADFVVFSMHSHEGHPEDFWKPAEFHEPFAHDCIDAGADIYLGHGPHYMRGLEIYHGKPIFYSLGNFVFQNETVRIMPHDNYLKTQLTHENTPADYYDKRSDGDQKGFPSAPRFWQSVLPWCRFEDGKVVEIKLYPITLGFGKKRTVRGRPMLALDAEGADILRQFAELSQPFGTTIEIKDNVGYVKL